jgi:lysozyme
MNSFDNGLGQAARASWSGSRPTPNTEAPLPGFFTGIVMDDSDDQRMGQVWVYIPGVSQERMRAAQALPVYGGTAPDRDNSNGSINWDQNLRNGWIQCSPLMPFFGGDDFRVQSSPGGDYRNAGNGDTNTYGMWMQPRIGDEVGILFAMGDAAKGYWIGMVPKYVRNFMVPGAPGRPRQDFDDTQDTTNGDSNNTAVHKVTKQLRDETANVPNALIPGLDKARRLSNNKNKPVERELVDVLVSPDFAQNVQKSGLLCDVLRGAGNSSSRRESPSYVFGFKTAGWNFDSEKGNLNTANGTRKRFKDENTEHYTNVNAMGHQFTMDDHPDYQGIRLRTSAGSQLYFSDACNEPFIYIATARGNVWVEIIDNGKINIFAEDSVSVHARNDINLTADRDINIDAQRDLNIQARRNTNIKLKGTTQIELGKDDAPPQDLTYNDSPDWGLGAVKDTSIQTFGNMDVTIGTTGAPKNLEMLVTNDWDIKANGSINIESGTTMDFLAVGAGTWTAATHDLFSNIGNFTVTATPDINFNGPQAATASAATPPTEPLLPTPSRTYRAPTDEEIQNCEEPPAEFVTWHEMVVPQHQPFPLRCQQTLGLRGFTDESPVDVTRNGATTSTANKPLDLPEEARLRQGNTYSTANDAEAPVYTDVAPQGTFSPCNTYRTSDKGINFLHTQEGFRNKAYPDANGYSIGYGHFIVIGDIINGDTINGRVTQADLDNLRRTKGQLNVSDAEARRIFKLDLVKFEAAVCNQVTTNITQGQFDAMVSYSYNGGEGALRRMVQRSNFNSGDFSKVPQAWMRLSTCSKCPPETRARIEEVLRRRRRQELEELFSNTSIG